MSERAGLEPAYDRYDSHRGGFAMSTTEAGRIIGLAIDEASDPAIAEQIGAAIDAMKAGQLRHVLERYGDQAFITELLSALASLAAISIDAFGPERTHAAFAFAANNLRRKCRRDSARRKRAAGAALTTTCKRAAIEIKRLSVPSVKLNLS